MSRTGKLSRVQWVERILSDRSPYRYHRRAIRAICEVLPLPRKRYRLSQALFIAAIVALPFSITESPSARKTKP